MPVVGFPTHHTAPLRRLRLGIPFADDHLASLLVHRVPRRLPPRPPRLGHLLVQRLPRRIQGDPVRDRLGQDRPAQGGRHRRLIRICQKHIGTETVERRIYNGLAEKRNLKYTQSSTTSRRLFNIKKQLHSSWIHSSLCGRGLSRRVVGPDRCWQLQNTAIRITTTLATNLSIAYFPKRDQTHDMVRYTYWRHASPPPPPNAPHAKLKYSNQRPKRANQWEYRSRSHAAFLACQQSHDCLHGHLRVVASVDKLVKKLR